jgi:hypothetical protein
MKRTGMVVAALALALVSCALDTTSTAGSPGKPDPKNPNVQVVNGAITIDQEELVFAAGDVNVLITWRLGTPGYSFPRDGIVFVNPGTEFAHCGPQANGARYSCVNVHSKPGRYKYWIHLEDAQGKRISRDPFVVNN